MKNSASSHVPTIRSLNNQSKIAPHIETVSLADRENDAFFAEPIDPHHEARAQTSEVIRRLLIWMADGRTLDERGLRASVALYCIRPDLIDGVTLEQIGFLAGCSRQAVHKLAGSFRETTGWKS